MTAHIKVEGGGPWLVYLEILGKPYKLVRVDNGDAERAARYLAGIEAEALAWRHLDAAQGGPSSTLYAARVDVHAARAENEGRE